jgi:hypothetical protein
MKNYGEKVSKKLTFGSSKAGRLKLEVGRIKTKYLIK